MTVSLRARGALAAAALAAIALLCAPGLARAAAPVNVVSPTITGQPRVGQTLSASQGEWQGAPTSFFYQWLRCDGQGANCAAIGGATAPQFSLTQDDLGARLRVEVIATNADGASPARRSAATAVIKVPVPRLTAKPTISGSARQGETLSATTGTWTGSPTSYAYQWKRCANGQCVSVAGATAATYLLTSADVGLRVRVRVEARNAGGAAAAQSNSTATVVAATSGFKLGAPRKDQKRGLARFRVQVPTAGLLTLQRTAKVQADSRRAFSARDGLKLTVKPRGRAVRQLRRSGKARVNLRVRFAADAGPVIERRRQIVLRAN